MASDGLWDLVGAQVVFDFRCRKKIFDFVARSLAFLLIALGSLFDLACLLCLCFDFVLSCLHLHKLRYDI